MDLVRHLEAFALVLLLGLPLAAADGPVQALTEQRDALKQTLAERFARDEAAAPGMDVDLVFDKGLARRGKLVVHLHHIGGAWTCSSVEGLGDTLALQEVDVTGLKLAGERLTGPLVIRWTPTGAEDDDATLSQTFTLDVKIVPVEERLVLTCCNMVGGDLTWRFVRTDAGWTEEHGDEDPVLHHAWGDFAMAVDDLAMDAEGHFSGRAVFTCITSGKSEHKDKLNEKKPVITFRARLVDGRVSAVYQLDAPGGKHMFGLRTEALTGAIQTRRAAGKVLSKGDRGQWIGEVAGPVLPASLGLNAVDAIAPGADDDATRQAAALYRQVLVLGSARDRYPTPIPVIMNRTPVPLPTWSGDAGKDDYLAALAAQAAAVAAGPSPAVPGGDAVADAPRFGPYYGDVALAQDEAGVNVLPAVAAEGAQDWRFVGGWSFCGPFAVYDQRTPVRSPEVIPAAGVAYERERVFVDHQVGESTVKRDTIGWIPAGQTGALVHAPNVPEAFSASHFYYAWYATAEVDSAVEQEAWVALAIDGQVRLWVNGQAAWQSGRDDEGITPNRFRLKLAKGRNRLLVRVGSSVDSNRAFDRVDWFEGYGAQPQGRVRFSGFALHACLAGAPGADASTTKALPSADAVGYRVNGNGGPVEADPPLAWDLEKGVNVAWRVELPRGTADPVVRDGRVLVTAEPHHLFCFDLATGQQLWHAAPSVLALVDPQAFGEGDPLGDYVAWKAAWNAKRAAAGRDKEAQATLEAAQAKEQPTHQAVIDALERHGISERGDWACSTPLVTADRVYVSFGTGVVACFETATGKPVWQKAHGHPWADPNMGSPRLAGDTLVVQVHLRQPDGGKKQGRGHGPGTFGLIGFDPATGAVKWTCQAGPRRVRNQHGRAQGLGNGLAVMGLENGEHRKHLVITGDGCAVDAADGSLLRRDLFGFEANRTPPVVKDCAVYITPVGGLEAVTMWLDATGRLGTRALYRTTCPWGRGQVKTTTTWGWNHWMKGPVVTDDTIYAVKVDSAHVPQHHPLPWTQVDTWDRATGRYTGRTRAVIRDATDPTVAPVLAGGWLIAADGGDPVPGFDGTVGTGRVAFLRLGHGTPAVVTRSQTGKMRAAPVPAGDRLLLREYGSLACIRVADDAGRLFVETVKAQVLRDEFPKRPEPQPLIAVTEEVAEVPDGVPVSSCKSRHLPDDWLVCAPVPAGEDAKALEALGGAAALRPTPATTIGDVAFRPLDPALVQRDQHGTPQRFDLFAAAGKHQKSCYYLYTVLEVPEVGVYKYVNPTKGFTTWLGGKVIGDGDVLSLAIGRFPLLVRVEVGQLPPFIKAMPVAMTFSKQKEDPTEEYERWIEDVRRNQDRFEAVLKNLPKSEYAAMAVFTLKRLEQWDERHPQK